MTRARAKKVLLIGWDAADWTILGPLLEQGRMPAFADLLQRGASGKISTLRPILSPMLWNSIATGKRPDLHGIYGFVEPRPDGSGIRPVSSTSRKCKVVWNILSQNGLKSIVVNWFASFPAEPIDGVIVTDRFCTQSLRPPTNREVGAAMVHPGELASELAELIVSPAELDAETILSFIPAGGKVDQQNDDRVQKLARLVAKTATIQAAACKLMREQPWDFMAVYFDAIDHFGHTFMPYHPPALDGIDPIDAEVYGPCITGCYQFHDMMLGAMLEYAGPDTTVILVSDHGFHSEGQRPGTNGYQDPVSWHRPYGVVATAGPGIKPGEKMLGVSLLDVTPTVLALLGLPVGADMDGRPWIEVFDSPQCIDCVESWESIDGDDGMHPSDVREDPMASAEVIRQLVDLGYVEPPDGDVQQQIDSTLHGMKYNQALALTYSGRREQAIPMWEELIEQADEPPTKRRLQVQLATCLIRQGRYAEAEKLLYSFGLKGLQMPIVRMMFATVRLNQDRGQEALEHLQSASSLLPENSPQLLAQLGLAYLQTHRWDQAYEHFHAALADDENVIAYCGLAELANLRGQHEQAVDYALRSIEIADALPPGHYQLGLALSKLGMMEEAILATKSFLRLAPTVKKGHDLLAQLSDRQGANPSEKGNILTDDRVSDLAASRLRRYLQTEC